MATLLKCYKPVLPLESRKIPIAAAAAAAFKSFRYYSRTRPTVRCLSTIGNAKSTVEIKVGGTETELRKQQQLWLHNTMSKQKELFIPKVPGKVGMYVCGVTAYDLSHIGHARVYVCFDVLYRYLNYLGYEVNYVRNFTDVDDKIIARANELNEDPIKLSRLFCEEFHQDMSYLHCLPPSVEPRVSDHMPHIIDMIQQILDNGCAYSINGDVYFSVDKFPEYGKLSGRKLEDNRAGERVAVDARKKHPADFALWKSAKAGEPFWESPWGPGRPGWHIECSAMNAAYLGYSFNIHGGGMDLVFPHHENEIARICAACRTSNTSYWIHNGFVNIDSERGQSHWGTFLQFDNASDRLFYIYQALYDCQILVSQHDEASWKDSVPAETASCINKFQDEVLSSISDDLHTPVVLAAMSDPLKLINDLLHTRKGKKQALRIESLVALENTIRNVLETLGLVPASYAQALCELKEKALKRAKLTDDQVHQKITERETARKKKRI
ncbi:cysteine-tRNA ligase, chloroplastic/mitochondrial [Capsicum chacoense]